MENKDSIVANMLINTCISDIGRSCDVVWIIFNGSSEIALHSQCTFRIVSEKSVFLTSIDMYFPRDDIKIDDFVWDIPGQSLFEQRLDLVKQELLGKNVINVEFSKNHDMYITLENGVIFQFFRIYTWGEVLDNENIRIFDSKAEDSPHYLY